MTGAILTLICRKKHDWPNKRLNGLMRNDVLPATIVGFQTARMGL